jgi:hypothetical protein
LLFLFYEYGKNNNIGGCCIYESTDRAISRAMSCKNNAIKRYFEDNIKIIHASWNGHLEVQKQEMMRSGDIEVVRREKWCRRKI